MHRGGQVFGDFSLVKIPQTPKICFTGSDSCALRRARQGAALTTRNLLKKVEANFFQ